MTSVRQNKATRLIQKELSTMFQRESANLFGGSMVSVTQVRISPDLKSARVYVSCFGGKAKNEVMDHIREIKSDIRRRLGIQMKNQLRNIPELFFFLDDSIDYEMKISDILNKDKEGR